MFRSSHSCLYISKVQKAFSNPAVSNVQFSVFYLSFSRAKKMKFGLELFCILFVTFHRIINSAGVFFEILSKTGNSTITDDSSKQTNFIHKSYHQCSMKETCNYVSKNDGNGIFSLYDSEGDLPQDTSGLLIWKKFYSGKFVVEYLH